MLGMCSRSLNNVPLNSPFSIDIVVDSVPPPGIFGVGMEVNYQTGVLRVTGLDTLQVLHFSGADPVPFEATDPLPDSDGSYRIDSVDLSGNDEIGPGRVVSLTLECLTTGDV